MFFFQNRVVISAEDKPQFLFSAAGSNFETDDSHRMLMDDLKITPGSVSNSIH